MRLSVNVSLYSALQDKTGQQLSFCNGIVFRYCQKEKLSLTIKAYVREKYGFEVHSAYIGQVKEKLGIRERKNYNVGSGKHPMPPCPPEKEEAIKDAFKHFKMI